MAINSKELYLNPQKPQGTGNTSTGNIDVNLYKQAANKVNSMNMGPQNPSGTGTASTNSIDIGAYKQAANNVMTQNRPAQSDNLVGIRNSFNGTGLDPNKVDWDGGNVTYDGKYFMTPSKVVDGVSYATQADINAAMGAIMNEQGLTGIRNTLVNRGISSDRIGWNDATKSITIDGKDFYKPTNIVDGKSYASVSDINGMTNDIYKRSGNELVGATDYAAGSGLKNIVQWTNDGRIMVGGQSITPKYVTSDGKAMVSKRELDAALAAYKEDSGILGDKEVYDNWNKKYGNKTDSQLNKILNRKDWDYDPYKDAAYLAYRDQYMREGNRAYQDAYAQMAGATGGYGSSAAATAGGQQLNYYMQQLNDRVPELQQNSWNRYVQDYDMNRQALEALRAAANDNYNKLYTANNDAYNRVNEAADKAYERSLFERYDRPIRQEDILQAQERTKQDTEATKQAYEQTEQAKQQTSMGAIDDKYYERRMMQQIDRGDVEIDQLIENLDFNKYVNAFDKAYERGWFNDNEAAIIGYTKNMAKYPDSNGYPNPKDGAAISDLYYWRNYGKLEFDDQQNKIIEGEIKKINAQANAEIRVAAAKLSMAGG